jgi:hypothetical protein
MGRSYYAGISVNFFIAAAILLLFGLSAQNNGGPQPQQSPAAPYRQQSPYLGAAGAAASSRVLSGCIRSVTAGKPLCLCWVSDRQPRAAPPGCRPGRRAGNPG